MSLQEMHTLLNEALNMAAYFLEKNDAFFPFGVVMAEDGELHHWEADGAEDDVEAEEIIEGLVMGMRENASAGDIRASAVVADVRISSEGGPEQDAVSVQLEHRDESPVICFLPYFTNEEGELEFGEVLADRKEREVFV
jgi:hypothetical protein